MVMLLGSAWGMLGFAYFLQGEMETALKFAEKGLKMQMDIGYPASINHWCLSFIHFDLGNWNEATVHAEQAVDIAQASHQKLFEALSRIQLGKTLGEMEGSQLHEAEEHILQGIKMLEELGARTTYASGYLSLGEFFINAGQKEKAIESLKKAEAMFEEMGGNYWLARTKKFLKTVRT
jgi:tetratricopeptide (TPR) repeat protein